MKRLLNAFVDFAKWLSHIRYIRVDLRFLKPKAETVYIIRFFKKEGLMSMLYKACSHIEYALEKGYIPYIDIKHFSSQYRIAGENAWERFFYQPNGYKEIHVCNYIISNSDMEYSKERLFGKYWAESFDMYLEKSIAFKKYFRLNDEIDKNIEIIAGKLGIEECIGVLLRGTDYVSLKPKHHPIQPTMKEAINKIDLFIEKYDKKLFLVTEDESIKCVMEQRYGKRVTVIPDDVYVSKYLEGKKVADSLMAENLTIEAAQKYLMKIVLLSRCKYLIAGRTNGSLMAMIMNGNQYEDYYLFDKGMYE